MSGTTEKDAAFKPILTEHRPLGSQPTDHLWPPRYLDETSSQAPCVEL